ncbi:MAG: hypothetical protein OES21_07645 [Myxococcales bacterium]|jgi:hypothetical protein|nr:hypothetical protein [Myxococcales bacterium]
MPFAVEISGFLAAFTALIGVWGVFVPSRLITFAARFGTARGLWFAAGIRVVLGLALWFAAPASRAPLLLQVLGAIALVAGLMLPFIGLERFKALLDWWTQLSPVAIRVSAVFSIAFGAAVLWALMPSAT